MRRYPSLVNLLFEDEKPDKEAIDTVKKLMPSIKDGPTKMLKFLNGPGADPKVRAVLDMGDKDGNPADEKATHQSSSPSVGNLVPTQKEIELTKSISYPLAKFESYKSMMSGGIQKVGSPIVINGNLIVDGHHRWSSLFSVTGPDGKIVAIDLNMPEKTAPAVLAAVQVAIAATKKDGSEVPSSKAGAKNILGLGKDEIKSLIEDSVGQSTEAGEILTDEFVQNCIDDPAVAKYIGIKSGTKLEEARKAIIEKTADNLSKMNQPADGSPPRTDMPQLDKAEGGVDAIVNDMDKGEINYKQPFFSPPSKKESFSKTDAAILERWGRLAGIIKG